MAMAMGEMAPRSRPLYTRQATYTSEAPRRGRANAKFLR